MENKFKRDTNSNALINIDTAAYNARKLSKLRAKKQKKQEDEIESLKQEVEELKAIINTIISR